MKNNIYLLMLLFISLQYSCSNNTLEELSQDPNNPSSVTPTLLLTASEASILDNYGYYWNRYAGAFVQTFAGNHATGVNADQYNLTSNDFKNFYDNLYKGGLKDCYDIINTQGPAVGAWHHVGVAKILLATGLGALTDVYGDIPYSESFDFTNFKNPSFDKQSDIYNTINTLLTEAVVDLNKTADFPLDGDVVHGNDVDKWKATAYLLLARYSNHMSKVDPLGSATAALQYVDMAKAAGLNDNSWNYSMKYDNTDPKWRNPWYELYENNLIIASSNFMDMLTNSPYGSFDPRLFSYWNTVAFGGAFVDFTGQINGTPTGATSFSPVGPQGYYGKVESPLLIATHFELLFIEAEAAMRSGDNLRAAIALNAALISQLNLVSFAGVDHVSFYFGVGTATSTNAISSRVNAYISFNSPAPATITMEQIMTEKYKAMFTMNLETWVDLRRHDYQYPTYLALPVNSTLTDFIRRGLYPQSEVENNSSTPTGVLMLDRLWWDN